MPRRIVSVSTRLTPEKDRRFLTDDGRLSIKQAGELLAAKRREQCSRAARCTLEFCMEGTEVRLTCDARDSEGNVDTRLDIEGCAQDSIPHADTLAEFRNTVDEIVAGQIAAS